MARKIFGFLIAAGVIALFGIVGGMEVGTINGSEWIRYTIPTIVALVIGVVGLNATEE